MRGVLAGLIIALVIVFVALLVATLGALGVAAIGWLLSQWFELTQWQGSLIALAVALSIGFAVYRLSSAPEPRAEPDWMVWDEDADENDRAPEPPVVAWRRQRPTEGNLPSDRPAARPKPKGSRRP